MCVGHSSLFVWAVITCMFWAVLFFRVGMWWLTASNWRSLWRGPFFSSTVARRSNCLWLLITYSCILTVTGDQKCFVVSFVEQSSALLHWCAGYELTGCQAELIRKSLIWGVRKWDALLRFKREGTQWIELRKMEEETKRELELKQLSSFAISDSSDYFDIKCIHLVPPFCERDIDKYFVLFERTENTFKWPKNVWSLLLQCVCTGKAQGVSLLSETMRWLKLRIGAWAISPKIPPFWEGW